MYKNPYVKVKPKTRKPYTEIYLIRHCHPDYNLEKKVGEAKMPLSKTGLKQRRMLTNRLVKINFSAVYSSELTRALESAELYLKKTNKKLIVDKRLNEINWIHWQRAKFFNMSEKTREKKFPNYQEADLELDKMQAKTRRTLNSIFKKHLGKKVAIFSHGNLIKAMVTGILNADVLGFLSLEIYQSSITKLVIDRDGYVKIAYINNAGHLPETPKEDLFAALAD
jgi:broad specificity phosphatase PhoE